MKLKSICLYTFSSSLQQHMVFFFRISLTADDKGPQRAIILIDYQSHVQQQQRCHLACDHEASFYLMLSATETRIKHLILSRNDLSLNSALNDEEVAIEYYYVQFFFII